MSWRIKNVPDWAESQFALLCDRFGAVRNKSSQDRTGWDYIVEFERSKLPELPHDRQPGSASARVQVKSTTTPRRQAQLKLSNALRFCRQPEPCFVVLFAVSRDGKQHRIYGREFDETVMSDVLKRARQADHDGIERLHRINFPLTFADEDEHTDDLIEWIHGIATHDPTEYARKKAELNDTLGYTSRRVTGTFRIRNTEIPSLIEHSVGLRPAVEIDHVELRDERFQIPARIPFFAGKPDQFELRVHPKEARLTFRDKSGLSASFDGEFRAFNFPGFEVDHARAAFVSPNIRADLRASGTLNLSFEFPNAEPSTLAALRNQINFRRIRRSEMTVALSVEGMESLISSPVRMESDLSDGEWNDWFDAAIGGLLQVARRNDRPRLSFDDLGKNWQGVEAFTASARDTNMLAEIELERPLPKGIQPRQFAYHAYLNVGDSTFVVVASRPLIGMEEKKRTLTMTFGWPMLHERSAKKGNLQQHLPSLRRRFRKFASRLGPGTITLAGGDFMQAAGGPGGIEISV